MITAMNTIIALLVLAAVVAMLDNYARHDRFAGPASSAHPIDDLGRLIDGNGRAVDAKQLLLDLTQKSRLA